MLTLTGGRSPRVGIAKVAGIVLEPEEGKRGKRRGWKRTGV